MGCKEQELGHGVSCVVTFDDDGDRVRCYYDQGYQAARRGEPESSALYKLDKHDRRAYEDGYAAYLEKARRNHREDAGLVD